MSLKQLFFTINAETGRFVNSRGANLDDSSKPSLFLNDAVILCLSFVNSNNAVCALGPSDAFQLAIDNDFDSATGLMAFSNNSKVDISGDWSSIDRSSGKISIRLNCNTAKFAEKLGSESDIPGKIEIKRYVDGIPSVILQDRCSCKNLVDNGGVAPEALDPAYYNSTQCDSKFSTVASLAAETSARETADSALSASLALKAPLNTADNTDAASVSNEGRLRYRKTSNLSAVDMSMKTGASSYAWIEIMKYDWQ